MRKHKVLAAVAGAILITGLPFVVQNDNQGDSKGDIPPTIGNVNALKAQYSRWKADYVKFGGHNSLGLKLGHFRGVSKEYTSATGSMILDHHEGGLSEEELGRAGRLRL